MKKNKCEKKKSQETVKLGSQKGNHYYWVQRPCSCKKNTSLWIIYTIISFLKEEVALSMNKIHVSFGNGIVNVLIFVRTQSIHQCHFRERVRERGLLTLFRFHSIESTMWFHLSLHEYGRWQYQFQWCCIETYHHGNLNATTGILTARVILIL